jgi:hypothetical protein
MFTEIVEVGGAALSLFENRKSILRILRRFRRKLFQGTGQIPIFGDGGTGKTTLGKFLVGELDTDIAVGKYRTTLETDKFSLPGEIPCVLHVPPGQERYRPAHWPALYRLLSEGKAGGIINIVSWGYHSTELEYERHTVYRKGMSEAEYIDAYLEYNRQREIKALQELAPHLQAVAKKFWMITLVTKQDLWWPERHKVEKHYKDGEYEACIQGITRVRGVANFIHHYYSVSLIPENLATLDGKILARTAYGYDQPIRIANLTSFAQGLNDLLK